MSDAARRKRPGVVAPWGDWSRSLFFGRTPIVPAGHLRDRVGRGELPLDDALGQLRRTASSIRPAGMLLDWGRRQLGLSATAEAEWFHRAWWGLWAGEMFRAQVHSLARHDDAMAIVDSPSAALLDRLRGTEQGMILAGAHFGPPHAALAWLLEQRLPLLAWTATSADSFAGRASGASLVDPSREPNGLVLAALHLRRGGVLFAALDGGGKGRSMAVRLLNGFWGCSTAVPALVRRLELPAERLLALWKGNRITIDCRPIASPAAALDDEAWNRGWIDAYWQPINELARTSPENLRYLLFWSKGAIRAEMGL